MNKRGHDILVIAIIVITVLLVGIVLLLKSSSPTGNAIEDLIAHIDITDFNAVYTDDGKVSISLALKSYENIDQELTGKLKIIIQSYSGKAEYNADFFFDGAFAKLQGIKGTDTSQFQIANPEGILVLTNSINSQATILSRISFTSPEFRGGPVVPENIAVTVQYVNYNKIYEGGLIIPFSKDHSGRHYTAENGKVEINY